MKFTNFDGWYPFLVSDIHFLHFDIDETILHIWDRSKYFFKFTNFGDQYPFLMSEIPFLHSLLFYSLINHSLHSSRLETNIDIFKTFFDIYEFQWMQDLHFWWLKFIFCPFSYKLSTLHVPSTFARNCKIK